ncbi:MAG: alpha-L-fucosidase [Deinococcota bacterium]
MAPPSQYEASWASLKHHPVPTWFCDAKFGIYFHWGPYSVPAYDNEWYSRNMYIQGSQAYEHHLKTYGPLDSFGYKDFIPMFTADKLDVDAWVDLFQNAGAKFAGPVAEHADGFAMWDSNVNSFNAASMGPKQDIVRLFERAIRHTDMKFIATLHHMWLWAWYPTWDKTVDASNPEHSDLYGPLVKPDEFDNPWSDDTFNDTFVAKIKEVIDGYQPDLLWFDARMDRISERHRQNFAAYYYNCALEWSREVGITYKNKDMGWGSAILDVERGRMSSLQPYPWLTDDSVCWRSWAHLHEPEYKSSKRLLDSLVDIVSKNGNLLLNIPPRADGTIPDEVQALLLDMGKWLALNGEAIYSTRPWTVYGEGPTKVSEGHFSEKDNELMHAHDIRYTTKGDALYAIVMGIPYEPIRLNSLSQDALDGKMIQRIQLLGSDEPIQVQQDRQGVTIVPPQTKPSDIALAFKLEFSPKLNQRKR